MLTRLYKVLPKSIRMNIYDAVADQVKQDEENRAKRIEDSLPHIGLTAKHIQNLQVFIDRDTLLSSMPEKATVAEIGVARGDFSEKILAITEPLRLHLIDSWSQDARYLNLRGFIEDKFETEIRSGQVSVHQGVSTSVLAEFEREYFDWVYIDTCHDYETTRQELAICKDKMKLGGIIAGHDYVTGNWSARIRYGVIEAVHEFCVRYDWEMIYLTHESRRHLSYALRQIEA